MITVALSLIFAAWTVVAWWWIRHIAIPAIAIRLDERRWQRLHPNMPSWRRVRP